MQKAQGSLEYLLIIGGGILVAVLSLTIIVNLASTGKVETIASTADAFCSKYPQSECDEKTITVEGYRFQCNLIGSNYCRASGPRNECTIGTVEEDCGPDGFGDPFCIGNDIHQEFERWTCEDGFCNGSSEDWLITQCDEATETCVDGSCLTNSICFFGFTCGSDGFVGVPFCIGNDVYQEYVSWGCQGFQCARSSENVLVEECANRCYEGSCTTIVCDDDSDCDDGDPYTADYCINPGTPPAYCFHWDIDCLDDSDCDDGNPITVDTCIDPGTINATCSHEEVACAADSDCDDSDPLTIDTCVNGGTLDSYCEYTPLPCNVATDCGIDGAVGDNFCIGDSVYQEYITYTCVGGSCASSSEDQLVEACANVCTAGECSVMDPNFHCGHVFTEPGTYVLQGDVKNPDGSACTGEGLIVDSGGVFIDCQGYTIESVGGGETYDDCSGSNPFGIWTAGVKANPCQLVDPYFGGGVKNCNITGPFDVGIIWAIKQGTVEDNEIHDIYLYGVFTIGARSEGIMLRNNTIYNGSHPQWATGILNDEGSGFTITGNTISNFKACISTVGYNRNLTITNNEVFNCKKGIRAMGLRDSIVSNNNIHDNEIGFYATGKIGRNNVSWTFSGNTLRNNVLNNNLTGFAEKYHIIATSGGTFIDYCKDGFGGVIERCYENDIDTSNTINGKPIYYYNPVYRTPPPEIDGGDFGYFSCAHCDGVTISNVTLNQGNYAGILLYDSHNFTINGNTISNNEIGVLLAESTNNTLQSNTMENNQQNVVEYDSSGNTCDGAPC